MESGGEERRVIVARLLTGWFADSHPRMLAQRNGESMGRVRLRHGV